MRRTVSFAAPILAAALVSGCGLPTRENPIDPNNRVVAAITVRVDGAESSIGGRGRAWTLDGSGSESPTSSVDSFTWEIANQAADDPEDPAIVWTPIGTTALVSSTASGSSFSAALFGVSDFGVDGGTTTTRFVRLSVEDENGSRDDATALLTIENHAPVLSLGPDLRVSPGGRWWTLAAGADVLTASPMSQSITLAISDEDGDEDLVATASAPARWRVAGALALQLDLSPLDGYVDDGFFDVADPGHRSLTFDVPLTASRNRFEIDASDVSSVTSNASATLAVDVLSNPWMFDRTTNHFTRLDTSRFELNPAARTLPIGADGSRAVLVEQGASLNLRVVDQSLRDVRRLNNTPLDAMDYCNAATDGADGWWVAQGGGGGNLNTLRHFSPSGPSTLVLDRTVTSVEGNGTNDFDIDAVAPSIARTHDGSKDVWVFGQTDNAGGTRLYRISVAGTLVASLDVPNGAAMVSDGASGVFVSIFSIGTPSIVHYGPTGTLLETFDGLGGSQMAYDTARGVLWVSQFGNTTTLYRRGADGTVLSVPASVDIADVFIDSTDGSLLVTGDPQVLTRFAPNDALTAIELRETLPIGSYGLERGVTLQGGSMIAAVVDFSLNRRLEFLEASTRSPSVSFALTASPFEASSFDFAVDPLTGFLWIFRPALADVEVRAADGSLVRRVDVGTGAVGGFDLASGGIAIDPESRTAYVAWDFSDGTGMVSSFPMDVASPTITDLPSSELSSIADIAVIPGGPVCVVAAPPGGGSLQAYALDPIAGVLGTPETFSGGGEGYISVDAAGDACWFFTAFSFEVIRVSGQGAVTSFASPTNPATAASFVGRGGGDTAQWNGLTYALDWHGPSGATTGWLTSFGPGTAGIAAVSATVPGPNTFVTFPTGIVQDPFYRHLWVSYGDSANLGTGIVLRLDANRVEVSRQSGFFSPQIQSLH